MGRAAPQRARAETIHSRSSFGGIMLLAAWTRMMVLDRYVTSNSKPFAKRFELTRPGTTMARFR